MAREEKRGTEGDNTKRSEGDINSVDIISNVTKFRKTQQGGTAESVSLYRYLL